MTKENRAIKELKNMIQEEQNQSIQNNLKSQQ